MPSKFLFFSYCFGGCLYQRQLKLVAGLFLFLKTGSIHIAKWTGKRFSDVREFYHDFFIYNSTSSVG